MRDLNGRFVSAKLDDLYDQLNYIFDRINFNDGCWEYTKLGSNGYGYSTPLYKIFGTPKLHRIMYTLFKGKIPRNQLIRHSCHNKACCNPKHLSVGTAKDNYDDMVNAGRRPSRQGLKSPRGKLNRADVIFIYKNYKNFSNISLSKMFNVSMITCYRIATNKTYTDVTSELKRWENRI